MKAVITSLCLLLYSFESYGQKQFGVKLTTGISTELMISGLYPGDDTYKKLPGLSGTTGVYYNWFFTKKSSLGIEMLFNHIVDIETYTFSNYWISQDLPSYFDNRNKARYNYLSVPVYYGLSCGKERKVQFNLGIQTSYLLSGSILFQTTTDKGSGEKRHKFKDIENPWEYGARLGLFINLSKKLTLEWNYYHGLTYLTKDYSYYSAKTSVIQTTVGLRYLIKDFIKSESSTAE